MTTTPHIRFTATLQRKDPRLPVYVVVPRAKVSHWRLETTTVVEGTVNGHAMGRRSMKQWSAAENSDWFVEYTAPFCKAAGIKVGDGLTISLRLANTKLPDELEALLKPSSSLRAAWNLLSESSRRASMEHVRAGKAAATRARRAVSVVAQLQAPPSQVSGSSNAV